MWYSGSLKSHYLAYQNFRCSNYKTCSFSYHNSICSAFWKKTEGPFQKWVKFFKKSVDFFKLQIAFLISCSDRIGWQKDLLQSNGKYSNLFKCNESFCKPTRSEQDIRYFSLNLYGEKPKNSNGQRLQNNTP